MKDRLQFLWEADHSGKMTRKARAERMGLCIATSEKILQGKGVDRATLVTAFRSVGLKWLDDYAVDADFAPPAPTPAAPILQTPEPEPVPDLPAAPDAQSIPPEVVPLAVALPRRPDFHFRRLSFFTAIFALLCVGLLVWQRVAIAYAPHESVPSRVSFARDLNIAQIAYDNGDYGRANVLVDRLLTQAQDEQNASLAEALRLHGSLETVEGNYDQAIANFRKAIDIRTAFGQTELLPSLYELLGDAQTSQGDYVGAHRNLTAALNLYELKNDLGGTISVKRDLGTVAYLTGDNERAIRLFDESLAHPETYRDSAMVADVRARRALVLGALGRLTEARHALQESMLFWQSKGHYRWMGRTQCQLGELETMGGNPAAAIAHYEEARSRFALAKSPGGVIEAESRIRELSNPAQTVMNR